MTNDSAIGGIYRTRTLGLVWLGLTAICVALAFSFAPVDWSALRTVAGGTVVGTWSFYCLFINHLLAM